MVLDHKLAPGELLGGDHTPALAVNEVNLLRGEEKRCSLTSRVAGCLGSPTFFSQLC